MDNTFLRKKERPNVLDSVFIAQLREDIAERIETMYPKNVDGGVEEIGKKVRESGRKFAIDTWVGDAFAWICRQKHGLNGDEIELLRKELFVD